MEQFEQAKNKLSHLKKDPGNDMKLKIYALFKQVGCVFNLFQSHAAFTPEAIKSYVSLKARDFK